MQWQRGPPDSSLRLWRVFVCVCVCVCGCVCVCVCVCVTWAAMPDGASMTWTPPILVKMPPHGLVWATANPHSQEEASLPPFSSNYKSSVAPWRFEAIQIWWLLPGSWRGWSWALHRCALLTYCLCVHLLMRWTDAAWFLCAGPHWMLGSNGNYLTLSCSFVEV